MPLESGTRLGPYAVLEAIGEGGMGEVHKATDTRLNRTVAVKVLPQRFSEDAEMKARFEREARAIAALKHPNICTLHDVGHQDGVDFLVMEYLEGQTLAQRLGQGPLPQEEAVDIAIQIADALDKAHAQGITHRDLKPGNVMLTEDGAKLLDFGLSKLSHPEAASDATQVDSSLPSTTPGTVLGTLPYMAPEQLEGNDAGPRTDLFAFGAVLYEMLTGKRAFEGKSQAVLIAAIVSADPEPLSTLVPGISPSLEFLVRRCLEKDPEERIQTASDVLAQLRWIASGAEAAEAAADPAASRRDKIARWGLVAAAILIAVLIPSAVGRFLGADEGGATRFLVNVPDMPVPESVAMSPDGRIMAFAARDAGSTALFLRPTDALRPRRVAGSEGAARPFWSPDSRWVAFYASGQLKRVNIDGSAQPDPIADVGDFDGGTWNEDDVILFASRAGLQRVPAPGGDPVAVLAPDDGPRSPWFLPDGDRFLYLAGSGESAAIRAGSLVSRETSEVLNVESNPVYVEPGYLLYHRQGTLYADEFDAGSLAPGGEAIRIADGIPYSSTGIGAFSASENGVLIYRSTPPEPDATDLVSTSDVLSTPLVWVDRSSGGVVEVAGEFAGWKGVDLSPVDGRRIAAHRHDPGGGDVWIFEPGFQEPQKLTFDVSQDNSSPIWSPDGTEVAFGSQRNGQWNLYRRLADNSGEDIPLLQSELDSPVMPMSWVGDVLVYTTPTSGAAGDIWYLNLTGDGASEPVPFLPEGADERNPQLSPDGRWIAYSSNRTGQSEVYIQPFPEGPGLVQISVDGGVFPRWRGDGAELYFMDQVSFGGMMAVPIAVNGSQIRRTRDPAPLFQTGFLDSSHAGASAHAYAVTADGQRFLIPQRDSGNLDEYGDGGAVVNRILATVAADRNASGSGFVNSAQPIQAILNWTRVLRE